MINSLITFTNIADQIVIEPAGSSSFQISGPFADHAPVDDSNLVLRAVRLMEKAIGKTANIGIALQKNIPAGAGLGGGSSDAACVMHALNELWGAPLSLPKLQALGLRLGAELPACLAGGAQWVEGIGEKTIPASAPTYDAVVIWPGKVLSTALVFKAYHGRFSKPMHTPSDVAACRNDLEEAAIMMQPVISTVLGALRVQDGCSWARMSGSGSACFGVFKNEVAAKKAAADLAAAHRDWWVKPCRIN